MKKLSIVILSLTMIFFSCADEDLEPLLTSENAIFGAYVKLVSRTGTVFDLADFGTQQTSFEVEFYDVAGGTDVTNYDIYVELDDNTSHNGSAGGSRQLLKGFTPSDFGTSSSGSGNVGMSVTITGNEVLSTLGLSVGDLAADDEFDFISEITLEDGRKFSAANSTAAVQGSAFSGFFNFSIDLQCPLSDDMFTGTYLLSYETQPTGGLGPIFGADPGTVTVSRVNDTRRRFTWTYLPDDLKVSGQRMNIDFKCDRIVVPDMDMGSGCLGTNITVVQGDVTNFDLGDDSSFIINLVEFDKDGGCGQDKAPVSIRLTKM